MKNKLMILFYMALYPIQIVRNMNRKELLVLTYHRIGNRYDKNDSLVVSKQAFNEQIKIIKENYSLLDEESYINYLKDNSGFPEKTCLITFDDGWKDNYTQAYSVLRKHKVPAVIFLAVEYIGKDKVFWPTKLKYYLELINTKEVDVLVNRNEFASELNDYLYEIASDKKENRQYKINLVIEYLKKYKEDSIQNILKQLLECLPKDVSSAKVYEKDMLEWEDVKEMQMNGISFGSHTMSHCILTTVSTDEAYCELLNSKNKLEKETGKKVTLFSYPNGNYNGEIIHQVKQAGYISAFTCDSGININKFDQFTVKRKHIRECYSLDNNGRFSRYLFKADLLGVRDIMKKLINKT